MVMAPLARWSSRIAVFSACLLAVDVVLHRLASFPTRVAINLFAVGSAGAGLAVLLGLIALGQIWRKGYAGAGAAALGLLLPLLALAWPLTFVPAFLSLPHINDITTDLASPPPFIALVKARPSEANPIAYPGERFAGEQQKAYPDLRTFVVDRGAEEAFGLVEEVARKLKWRVAAADPPTLKPLKSGVLEATDLTTVAGFTDDIIVRVEGGANRSRVDVRSASRYGQADLGHNATRVRRFLAELQAQIDSTAVTPVAGRRALRTTRTGAMVKKVKAADPAKAESRNKRERVPSSAQRGRAPKEMPR
jgi:Protein of unknown function (DUF1499)